MPKVKASMADVSTDFTPISPGVYLFEVKEVEEKVKDGRVQYNVKSEVIEPWQGDGEADMVGKSLTDRVSFHKKDGSLNEYGVAQLKRYFEVTLGEDRANAEDADTDELLNQQFVGQVDHESYEAENVAGNKETRTSARLAAISSPAPAKKK